MRLLHGTSGYSYKEWRGAFYPEDLAADEFLSYYASQLPTVEINNTFYRNPKADVVQRWAEQVPDAFRFVIKASQRITHRAKLAGEQADTTLQFLWESLQHLGRKLGPVLFQLPPWFQKDTGLLDDFCARLPNGCRTVFEFRHPSWTDAEVDDTLRKHSATRCSADGKHGDEPEAPLVATTDWGYLRMREPTYDDAALAAQVERVRAQPWREVFVFFKHEDDGGGPALAKRFAIYMTGLGQVTPLALAGFAASESPLAEAVAQPGVLIGETPGIVTFAGLTPGFVGLYQVNVLIPGYAPTGMQIPLTIGTTDNFTTVNVRVVRE
jgi:uncharacterized protein YecE (DUF72 family)